MVIHDTQFQTVDGDHNLEVEIDNLQTVVRFGSSFTLRLEERDLGQLIDILQDSLDEVRHHRRFRGRQDTSAEDKMIQEGVEAREKLKAQRMMKGTATPTIDPYEPFNPDDPINW